MLRTNAASALQKRQTVQNPGPQPRYTKNDGQKHRIVDNLGHTGARKSLSKTCQEIPKVSHACACVCARLEALACFCLRVCACVCAWHALACARVRVCVLACVCVTSERCRRILSRPQNYPTVWLSGSHPAAKNVGKSSQNGLRMYPELPYGMAEWFPPSS